ALTVAADVAERVAPPQSLEVALGKTRGIVLRPRGAAQPELPPAAARPVPTVPLDQKVLRALVDSYVDQISDPAFRPARGLRLRPLAPARPLPDQRPDLLADVLLPPTARARIKALAPECVVIVPDGSLHKLPFEALLLRAGEQPSYVLDELPPLAY